MKNLFRISFLSIILLWEFTGGLSAASTNVFIKFKNNRELSLKKSNNNRLQQFSGNDSKNVNRLLKSFQVQNIQSTFRIKDTKFDNHYKLTLPDSNSAKKLVQSLSHNAEVEYAEIEPVYEDYYTPNDLLGEQWHLKKIHAEEAWNFGAGSKKITLAIVDDAVKIDHEDLKDNIWINKGEIPGNGIDDDGDGYIDDINGWDAADNDNNPMPPSYANADVFSHGTHCAGIASAVTDNGTGIASMGYNVSIMAVKCKADGTQGGTLTTIFEGLEYAIKAGADVISMSWGSNTYSQTMQDLFDYAHDKGITLIAAAGNDNSSMYFYPSACNHVISVGATTPGDKKATFSNFGNAVDVMAPGVGILSTIAGDGKYIFYSGTSMACPLVAGLAAYMKSLNPVLSPGDIENCLKNTADNIDELNPGYEGKLGAGRINALGAVMCSKPDIVTARFNIKKNNVCPGVEINFENLSKSVESNVYEWKFPGAIPESSTEKNPSVIYNNEGQYSVSLIVCNKFGCDTIVKENFVVISKPFITYEGNSEDTVCENSHTFLQLNLHGNPPFNVNWEYNGKQFSKENLEDSSLIIPVYPSTGISSLKITLISDKFCSNNLDLKKNYITYDCSMQPPKTDYVWVFGQFATLDFTPGNSLLSTESWMNSYQGCASISDKNGNLLFYSDGKSIWDAKSQYSNPDVSSMNGDDYSSQSALIVPAPTEEDSVYYVFTTGSNVFLPNNGIYYTKVDYRGTDPKFKVTETNKYLFGPVAQKLTAVPDHNNIDVWVITHEWNSNRFISIKVTKDGVVDTVISPVGSTISGTNDIINYASGYLKASSDGKRLAMAIANKSTIELYDFDNKTGVISNPYTLKDDRFYNAYGVEFSPNSRFVYCSSYEMAPTRVWQIDLAFHTVNDLLSNTELVGETEYSQFVGAFQNAPDGKMYVANIVRPCNDPKLSNNSHYVGVIDSPNVKGVDCGFRYGAIGPLGGTLFQASKYGLPNFYNKRLNNAYQVEKSDDTVCVGKSLKLNFMVLPEGDYKYSWTSEGFMDSYDIQQPTVVPDQNTTYLVTVQLPNGGVIFDSINITVDYNCCKGNPPIADFDIQPVICTNEKLIVKNNSKAADNAKYYWSFGDDQVSPKTSTEINPGLISYAKEGQYQIRLIVEQDCGLDTLIKNVTVYQYPVADAGSDQEFCYDEFAAKGSISLGSDPIPGYIYTWSPGEYLSDSTVAQPELIKPYTGEMVLKVVSSVTGCIAYDTIFINIKKPVVVAISQISEICQGDGIQLNASGGDFYSWSPSDGLSNPNIPNPVASPDKSTKYKVIVSKDGFCDDSAFVDVIVKHRNDYRIYFENNLDEYVPGGMATVTIHIKNLNYEAGIFTQKIDMKLKFDKFDFALIANSVKIVDKGSGWTIKSELSPNDSIINITAAGNTDFGEELAFSLDFLVLFRNDMINTMPLTLNTDYEMNDEFCITNPDSIKTDILYRSSICAELLHNVLISKYLFNLDPVNPNPVAKNIIQINYTVGFEAVTRIVIYNSSGQIVMELVNETKKAGQYSIDVNISNFAAGVYFYKMISGSYTETHSFVVE